MRLRYLLVLATLTTGVAAAQSQHMAPNMLPSAATEKLDKSLQDRTRDWEDPASALVVTRPHREGKSGEVFSLLHGLSAVT
jgi:hypothetical protein